MDKKEFLDKMAELCKEYEKKIIIIIRINLSMLILTLGM